MSTQLHKLALEYTSGRLRRREVLLHTARTGWSALSSLCRVHGNRPVAHLTEPAIERWLEDRAHLHANSLVQQWGIVSGFLDWLVKQGELRTNPMRDMRKPRRPRVQPITLLDGDEARLLASLPDARAHAIVQLELGMGARRVEVSRLLIEDWFRREEMVLLTGKAGHQRYVPVPSAARAAFDAYLAEHPATSGPFIRSYNEPGQPLTPGTIGKLVAEWMTEAGVKRAAWDGKAGHALRRTVASEVYSMTGDLRDVQELLGHADLSNLVHYVRRVGTSRLRDALEDRPGGANRLTEAA